MATDADIRLFTVPETGVERLDTWLVQMCEGFSRNRVQGLIDAGFVKVDGVAAVKSGAKLPPGVQVEVAVPPPVPAIPEPEDIPLSILFEDDDILVMDKPAGMVVHPAPGHFTGTLVNALLHHCPDLSGVGGVARPGIVHRLDQDTSGVMVVAKSEKAMHALAIAFAAHDQIRKTYLAVVHGIPAPLEGRMENRIARKPTDRKKMAIAQKGGKVAITNYSVVPDGIKAEYAKQMSLVACRIETGRTHQIRVHMASLGCPVAGDATYGHPSWDKRLAAKPARQLLHAWRLEFKHPVSRKEMAFTSPPPSDFTPFVQIGATDRI